MNTETLTILARTEANAPEAWRADARHALDYLAASGDPFTTETLISLVGFPDHPNRIGAVINAVARSGRIERVGFRESTRKARHSGLLRVWQGVAA